MPFRGGVLSSAAIGFFEGGAGAIKMPEIYVDLVAGSDTTGNGTVVHPFKTINKALTVVSNTTGTAKIIVIATATAQAAGSTAITLTSQITVTDLEFVWIEGRGSDFFRSTGNGYTWVRLDTAGAVMAVDGSGFGARLLKIEGMGFENRTAAGSGLTCAGRVAELLIARCGFRGPLVTDPTAAASGSAFSVSGFNVNGGEVWQSYAEGWGRGFATIDDGSQGVNHFAFRRCESRTHRLANYYHESVHETDGGGAIMYDHCNAQGNYGNGQGGSVSGGAPAGGYLWDIAGGHDISWVLPYFEATPPSNIPYVRVRGTTGIAASDESGWARNLSWWGGFLHKFRDPAGDGTQPAWTAGEVQHLDIESCSGFNTHRISHRGNYAVVQGGNPALLTAANPLIKTGANTRDCEFDLRNVANEDEAFHAISSDLATLWAESAPAANGNFAIMRES